VIEPLLLTEAEVAELLRMSTRTVRKFRTRGELPHVSICRRILYARTDVIDFVERNRVDSQKQASKVNVTMRRDRKGDRPASFTEMEKARELEKSAKRSNPTREP
jgi:excisionase family DNA binding protein